MGKVHALIGEQLKEAETEKNSVSLRDGLIAKAREIVDRMMTHWANLDDEELKVIVDDLGEWEKMADSAIEQMSNAPTPEEVLDKVEENLATVTPPPSVTTPPTPEPVADEAGQGGATDDPPQVPSQLDGLSSADDGPPNRLEYNNLLSRLLLMEANFMDRLSNLDQETNRQSLEHFDSLGRIRKIEDYIKRKAPDFS